ncbi:MAG: hypothetical protein COT37_02545 [Parcubacteria group bacterium CG08_land_8_20_14_0_20_43_9]|nr:MAG: hypothetical protein COT37_02545 [Parcubacteria group bacterium CG08_land_8_20_14_0_20_43_9]
MKSNIKAVKSPPERIRRGVLRVRLSANKNELAKDSALLLWLRRRGRAGEGWRLPSPSWERASSQFFLLPPADRVGQRRGGIF